MGRVIGDGGTTFQIVDIAVDPDYQGQGYGRVILFGKPFRAAATDLGLIPALTLKSQYA
jgi:GNAT superfamily N-acetyltransferase